MKKEPPTKAENLKDALGKYMQHRSPEEHALIESAASQWLDVLCTATEIQKWRNT